MMYILVSWTKLCSLDDHSVFSIMATVDATHSTSQLQAEFELLEDAQEVPLTLF
jgi:hypothetical protein